MQRIALLESEKHSGKAGAGSAASVALHVVVLAFAIAVTSHAGGGLKREDAIYIPLPRFQPEARPLTAQPITKRVPVAAPHVPSVSVAVPSVIPSIIPSPAVAAAIPVAIGAPSLAVPGSATGSDTSTAVTRGDTPFAADEVDVAAAALPGQRGPAYPDALRMMGVEGRVVARFIIGKNGRVETDPTIVSATDDQFANAVRRYLATARYRPASRNGQPVRQLAEQEFNFALRR